MSSLENLQITLQPLVILQVVQVVRRLARQGKVLCSLIVCMFAQWLFLSHTIPGWIEGFSFPPALQKLTVSIEGRTLQLFHQQCIAISAGGATVYGQPTPFAQNDCTCNLP